MADNFGNFRRFWAFLKKDTWQSWLVSLVLLVVIIRFIFFPLLSFTTGSDLPLVVIESCSLYHDSGFDEWWDNPQNSEWYDSNGISEEQFRVFPYRDGLNKGDIIFVWGRGDYEMGDIIIFEPNAGSSAVHPIIHRVVGENPYETKGDNNAGQLVPGNNYKKIDETNIDSSQIMGKASFRIPLLGWIKLIFFEPFRDAGERGFC